MYVNGHTIYKDVICANNNVKVGWRGLGTELMYAIEVSWYKIKLDFYKFRMLILILMVTTKIISEKQVWKKK